VKNNMKRAILIFVIIISLLYFLPVFFTFSSSFMNVQQLYADGVRILPDEFSLQQYYSIALYKGEYFKFYINSIVLTISIIIGQIVVGVFAAFALAKLRFPGRNFIFAVYVLVLLLPFQVVSVPNYLVFDKMEKMLSLKIFDTYWAIILPGIFSTIGIFLLRQFIVNIPNEIIEAARIDGASYTKIFFTIVLPLVRPAIISLIFLSFIDNWNLVEQAVIFIETPSKQPLSVFLETVYFQDYSVFYAASILYIIPAVFLLLKGEKYLQEGILMGGIK
jgi:multiple sugar transport system permease protein